MYINQIRLWKKGIYPQPSIRIGEYFIITGINNNIAYPYCTIRYLNDGEVVTSFLKRIDLDSYSTED